MKHTCYVLLILASSATLLAQSPPASPPKSSSSGTRDARPAHTSASASSVLPELNRLQTFASQSAQELADLHIDKWKANSAAKSAAQVNADSAHRNLTAALPGLIEAARAAPEDVNAEFKLYRNVIALYEVIGSVTEATRIFGQKDQYEALAAQLQTLRSVRRNLGEALEDLTASAENELQQMRLEIKNQQLQLATAEAAAAAARKELMMAQAEPPPKPTAKKKSVAKKPATAATGSTSNAAGSSAAGQTSSASNTPKP